MFNFGYDRRILYIIIAIIVVINIGSYISNPGSLLSLVLTVPAVLIAITFHEFAHAFVADKLGDDTPRRQGRLTLNPISHIDPIGLVMLIFAGFGWGKPVEIDGRNFNRKISMSAAEAIVSVAGPIMNLVLAILFALIYGALIKFEPPFLLTKTGFIIVALIFAVIRINIGLGIFNLIPLPPLDGSKILNHFLPYNAKEWFSRNSQIFYIVFTVLWITGIAGTIISPIINVVYKGIMYFSAWIFGL